MERTAVMSRGLDELFEDQPPTLTVSAAAKLLGRSNQTVYRWITAQTIPAYRVGKEWHIVTTDLKATMEAASNLSPPTDPPEEVED